MRNIVFVIVVLSCFANSSTAQPNAGSRGSLIKNSSSQASDQSATQAVKMPPMRQMIQAPILKPFADSKDFMLVRDMVYTLGETDISIVVPKGFVTDFASVPKGLWSFGLSPHGKFSKAAIIHDYLYWTHGCTREQSDMIMLIAMKESQVEKTDQFALYEGLDLAGNPAWVENKEDREAGIPRIIPPEYWDFPPDAIWENYKKELARRGIRDPEFPQNPEYCALGDSDQIPGVD